MSNAIDRERECDRRMDDVVLDWLRDDENTETRALRACTLEMLRDLAKDQTTDRAKRVRGENYGVF